MEARTPARGAPRPLPPDEAAALARVEVARGEARAADARPLDGGHLPPAIAPAHALTPGDEEAVARAARLAERVRREEAAAGAARLAREAARFAHVETWIFDLDNTLYDAGGDLWPQIDKRITAYVANLFGVDGLTAVALQKHYYRRHGTTLKGLMDEGVVDPADYLDFVHDVDRSRVPHDSALRAGLAGLSGRRLVFTNGTRDHALRTLEAVGLADLIEDASGIIETGFVPKPEREAYDIVLARHGVEPRRAAMVEDIARNLDVPKQLGMATLLVVPGGADHRDAWERALEVPPYVDAATTDLAGFLAAVPGTSRAP